MRTLRDILDTLPKESRRILEYAFEHDLSQLVELASGEYIGVNMIPDRSYEILEEVGVWSLRKRRVNDS